MKHKLSNRFFPSAIQLNSLPFARTLSVTTAIFLVCSQSNNLHATDYTWGGGTNGAWTTTANWSPSTLPGAGDKVIFNATTTNQSINLNTNRTVRFVEFNTVSVGAYSIGAGAVGSQTLTFNTNNTNPTAGITADSTMANDQLFRTKMILGSNGTPVINFTNNSTANKITFITDVTAGGSSADTTLNVDGAGAIVIDGIMANAASFKLILNKSNAGTLTLSGANTYTGATTLSGGVLVADKADAAGSGALGNGGDIKFTGGTLQYTANSAGSNYAARFKDSSSAIKLDTNGQAVTLGAIDSTNIGGLTKSGGGELTLSGANSYTGGTTINNGFIALENNAAAGAGAITVNGSGQLNAGGSGVISREISNAVNLAGGTVGFAAGTNNNSSFTLNGITTVSAASSINPGSILKTVIIGSSGTLTGAGNLTVEKGNLRISSNTTSGYTGKIVLNGDNNTGTLEVDNGITFGANIDVTASGFKNVIKKEGNSAAATITGNISLAAGNAGDFVVDNSNNAADLTLSGIISDSGSPTMGLRKEGTDGTLILTGANTYGGNTRVQQGNLLVNNTTGSGTGVSTVTVTANTTLGGSGTISGATTIQVNGTLAAGVPGVNSGVGTLTFGGDLALDSGSIFAWDLNSNSTASGFDKVVGGGVLNVDSGSIFKIVLGDTVDLNNSFWSTSFASQTWSNIFSGFSSLTGGFDTSLIQVIGGDISGKGSFTVTGTTLTWTAVPEPTSALAGLLLGAGLLRRRRA